MKYKNYIWDFDGTLFDSYPHILACMEIVLEEEGVSCDRLQLWRRLLVNFAIGKRYAGISDEAYRRFLAYQLRMGEDEIEPKIVPYGGIRELLSAILKNGGRNYLYTHRDKSSLGYLSNFGLDGYFSDFVTSEEGFPNKPAPDAVLEIIRRNQLIPAECVMVGDRLIDGMSGVNAGIAGVLITAATNAVKNDDDYDAVELELKYVPALTGVTRDTMSCVATDAAEFARKMNIPVEHC